VATGPPGEVAIEKLVQKLGLRRKLAIGNFLMVEYFRDAVQSLTLVTSQ
jgi:hypothetical protein